MPLSYHTRLQRQAKGLPHVRSPWLPCPVVTMHGCGVVPRLRPMYETLSYCVPQLPRPLVTMQGLRYRYVDLRHVHM